MSRRTVKQVARLSGVSVRTLHHYDEIGLLKPAAVGQNGYRYYGREQLLRLQQILFYRELGFPLEQISVVLADPGFNRVAALKAHRKHLAAEGRRLRRLIQTIDETLVELNQESDMDDKNLYRGFAPEKQAEYEAWLIEQGGEPMRRGIAESKAAMAGRSKDDVDGLDTELEAVETGVARALKSGLPADDAQVQALMRRHHAWVARMWGRRPTREAYVGLGELYLSHPDFRARYEGRLPGFTEYLAGAMRAFADREL